MGIGSFFKKIGNGIADVAKDIGEGIADVGGEIIETVGDVGKAAIKGDIKGMVHAVGDGVVGEGQLGPRAATGLDGSRAADRIADHCGAGGRSVREKLHFIHRLGDLGGLQGIAVGTDEKQEGKKGGGGCRFHGELR